MLALLAVGLGLAGPVEADQEPPSVQRGSRGRTALAVGSGAAAAAGTIWFLQLGDQMGSGDHAGLMIGGGFIGLAGAAVGALGSKLDRPDEDVHSAWVEVDLARPPAAWAGEARPLSAGLSFAPTLQGPRYSMKIPVYVGQTLGSTLDIDPNTVDRPALETSTTAVDVQPQALVQLGAGPIEVGVRGVAQERRQVIRYGGRGTTSMLERTLVAPAVPGVRLQVAPGQWIDGWLGPRWDRTRLDGEPAPLYSSALYGEAGWQMQVDGRGRIEAARLRLAYVHSNFDGLGFNVGPVIGFAGPFQASVDARMRSRHAWALQLGGDASVAAGGSMSLSIGLVPNPE